MSKWIIKFINHSGEHKVSVETETLKEAESSILYHYPSNETIFISAREIKL